MHIYDRQLGRENADILYAGVINGTHNREEKRTPISIFPSCRYPGQYPKVGKTKGKIYRSGGAEHEQIVEISENRNRGAQLETTEHNTIQNGAEADPNRGIEPKRKEQAVKVNKSEQTERKRHVDNMNSIFC